MINLQSNSIKFTQEGGSIDIYYSVYKDSQGASFLEVQIKDTGLGIKDEDKSKLFKLFGFVQTT